jgi:hypothetical protein
MSIAIAEKATIDERAARRLGFRGGVPVLLADGQEWILPHVVCLFSPDDSEAGIRPVWNLGDEYARLIDALDSAETTEQRMRAELALARDLLLRNYDLTTEQLVRLVQFGYNPEFAPEGVERRRAVLAIALGETPAP